MLSESFLRSVFAGILSATVCGVAAGQVVVVGLPREAPPKAGAPVPPPYAVLNVDKNGTATIGLTLENTSTTPAKLDLSITDFVHTAGGVSYDLRAALPTIAGATPADQTKLTAGTLAPGAAARVSIKITVNQLWESGESVGKLINAGTDELAELRATRIPAAFNVQLSQPTPETLQAPDSQPSLTVVNNDPMTYTFSWDIQAQGKTFQDPDPKNQVFTIPANSSLQLDISGAAPTPSMRKRGTAANFILSLLTAGTLKDDVKDASLVLHPQIASSSGVPPQPDKYLAFRLRSHFWTSVVQELAEASCTMLLLLVGGLASLWFRYYIPNALGALKLQRQLKAMEIKIAGTGDTLASKWRVMLLGYIADGRSGLDEIPWAFPGFSSRLTELQTSAAMYSAWIDIAYAASLVQAGTQNMLQQGRMPPTALDFIEQKLDDALEPIQTGNTTAEELQNMNAALKSAQATLQAIIAGTSLPNLETVIQTREAKVQAASAALQAAFPGFAALWTQIAAAVATPKPGEYLDRDMFSLKGDLLRQYYNLRMRLGAGVMAPQPPPPAAPPDGVALGDGGQTALTRLDAQDYTFRSYVTPDSVLTLRRASFFLTEMRQDFYEHALLAEAHKPQPAMEIRADSTGFRPAEPIHMLLRFQREELNQVAAVQEWTCRWNLGDGAVETGWDIYHQYSTPGTYNVTVTIINIRGAQVETHAPIARSFTVAGPPPAKRWLSRFALTPEAKVEAGQLAFVLAIALLGVFAAARDKVQSMSLVSAAAAIIAIGFGADTLKSLITQKAGDK
jgi:hypothetical protein